jgi:tetratricopeptide (TPR) repeat protein
MINLRSTIPTLCGFLILGLAAQTQASYAVKTDTFRKEARKTLFNSGEPLLPRAEILHALSLGHPETVADLIWLQTIQYFGGGKPTGKYPSLPVSINRTTALDPRFAYPYEFGMIVMPYMDDKAAGETAFTEQALALGHKAREYIPHDGWLRYHLASIYMLNRKDYVAAAQYYKEAAEIPGSPGAAKILAGSALSKISGTSEERLAAIQYWTDIKERNADAKDVADLADRWIEHLNIVYTTEKAAATYKERTGRSPATTQELVDVKLLNELPTTSFRPNGLEFIPDTVFIKDTR